MNWRVLLRRVAKYSPITIGVLVIWLLIRLSYGNSPPEWIFYLMPNIGLLFPYPWYPWYLSLIIGVMFIFAIIFVLAETLTWLFKKMKSV